jgi:hypothetical protein
MSQLESKVHYINELAKAKQFLPSRFYGDILDMLPEKSLNRVKNACSGIVQDQEVLAAIKKIAEKERKRRIKAAHQELKAVQARA